MKQLLYVILILPYCSCNKNLKIEIRPDYIINENWDETANSIKVTRMTLRKDSVIYLEKLTQVEVVNKLQEDTSFIYFANVDYKSKSDRMNKKIYFNRDNGFLWRKSDLETSIKVLGNLQIGIWYKFSRLVTYNYDIYVYIDSVNHIHRQDVIFSNF